MDKLVNIPNAACPENVLILIEQSSVWFPFESAMLMQSGSILAEWFTVNSQIDPSAVITNFLPFCPYSIESKWW